MARLVAVHTRDAGVLEGVAEQTGSTPYQDFDGLLGADDVDAVYIAVPTGLHNGFARATIQAEKHVWCEKPLSTSLEDADGLVLSAAQSGVVVLESDMFLHHPQFRELKTLLDSGEFGPIRSLSARFGFPHRDESDFRYSREMGGGALLDAGFYPVAAAVALLGADSELVGALVTTEKGMSVDTGGTALLVSNPRAGILDWGFGRAYRSEIEVWCEGATIVATRAFSKPADLTASISIDPQQGKSRVAVVEPADQFALMLDRFAAITLGEAVYDPVPMLARARILSGIGRMRPSSV